MGAVAAMLRGASNGELGQPRTTVPPTFSDPAKVAQVILSLADLEDPPLRLVLGSAAFSVASAAARARAAEDERWKDLSLATDVGEPETAD
jgi:hypothetical protein